MPDFWVNGIRRRHLSLADRIIHFGDGFFTTMRLRDGEPVSLDLHLARLLRSAHELGFEGFDIERIIQDVHRAIEGRIDGIVKIIVSRGTSETFGYGIRSCGDPVRIVCVAEIPQRYRIYREFGVRLGVSVIRLSRSSHLHGIKHNNRLEQVLIRAHADRVGFDEVVVLDDGGYLVECCSANLFWRSGRDVFTPSLRYAGVEGTTSRRVKDLLPSLGYSLSEVFACPDVLESAEEIFITSALLPVVAARKIGNRSYRDHTLSANLRSLLW